MGGFLEARTDQKGKVMKTLDKPKGRYAVKCDDCKTEIRRTNSIPESAAGGRCGKCK